jgi:hypothetical protein
VILWHDGLLRRDPLPSSATPCLVHVRRPGSVPSFPPFRSWGSLEWWSASGRATADATPPARPPHLVLGADASSGDYLCSDLACSLYIRGKKAVRGLGGRPPERLTLEEKTERTMANLAAFIAKVTGA